MNITVYLGIASAAVKTSFRGPEGKAYRDSFHKLATSIPARTVMVAERDGGSPKPFGPMTIFNDGVDLLMVESDGLRWRHTARRIYCLGHK